MSSLAAAVVATVRKVVGAKPAPLHRPFIGADDMKHVRRAAKDEPVGYTYIREMEDRIAAYLGVRHAVCVSSGTAAIHLALRALAVCGEDVRVPAMTFAGAAAAVRYCGSTPVVGAIPRSPIQHRVRIIVDLLGHPYTPLGRDGLLPSETSIIEDAAEALGSRWHGKPLGTFGKIGILSFNNNKIVTTGGGGAVVTDDDNIAERVRHLATTAKLADPWFFDHSEVGYNYRMTNLAAALGIGQMSRIERIVEEKRELARAYQDAFAGIDGAEVWQEMRGARANYWLNALSVPPNERNEVLAALTNAGYGCRALFTPLHAMAPYPQHGLSPETDSAEIFFNTTVLLPSGKI